MKQPWFAVFALLVSTAALAQDRLPTIAPERYTDEQKKAEAFLTARKVPVFGPFEPLMYSPQVMDQDNEFAQRVADRGLVAKVIAHGAGLVHDLRAVHERFKGAEYRHLARG